MTDIPTAKRLLESALVDLKALGEVFPDEIEPAIGKIKEAHSMMTRVVNKKPVRRGVKTTPEIKKRVLQMLEDDDFTDTEIAEIVYGHSCAAGRVSEIRNGLR